VRDDFHAAHERAYGYAAREDGIEMVNVRLTAIGVSPKPRRAALPKATGDVTAARKGERLVWFGESASFVACTVLDRSRLAWGHVVRGPAAIEEMDATTLVHPGWQADVDEHGNLVLSPVGGDPPSHPDTSTAGSAPPGRTARRGSPRGLRAR
jgi:N-methylhydantoinase A